MNVLSLFDGMSNGRIALEKTGFKVENYFASEIDPYAMKVSNHNYPDIKQIGDAQKVKGRDFAGIDLLLGGSPCQGFSVAGKRLNFDDERSRLFFQYYRILQEAKPKYFLLENVPMKPEYQDIISQFLGVKPAAINSSLVSAQNRKRLYWTNIPGLTQPAEKGIVLNDIIEKEVPDKYYINTDKEIVICDLEKQSGKIAFIDSDKQANRVHSLGGKSVTLLGLSGGWGAKTGLYWIPEGQGFKPADAKFYTLRDTKGNVMEGQIRKLTPLECERLQTVPEGYTSIVSDTQRYKMLGNGWTVDLIAHILKGMEVDEKIQDRRMRIL